MLAPQDEDLDVPNPLRRERAERLMMHSIQTSCLYNILALYSIHYRDEPELDEEDGLPLLRRDTPLHLAARLERPPRTIDLLFWIYSADYVNESGLRHFHVACRYGFGHHVERFLAEGQDPNCLGPGDQSPLHYAVAHVGMVELLLGRGARPNVTNAAGLTPLELAAANLHPFAVDALLAHGATDRAGLVFPIEAYCRNVARFEQAEFLNTFRALKLIEVAEETSAFELSRNDAREIVRVFARSGALDASARRESELTAQTEPGQILSRRLTLQNVLDMPDDESRLAAVAGCFPSLDLEYDDEFVPAAYAGSPITRACAAAARSLFRRWTADVFHEVCRARLPLPICHVICKSLSNEDLLHVLEAARL